MPRSIFGWDLPPGVTHRMIDEAFGGNDEPEEEEKTMPSDKYNLNVHTHFMLSKEQMNSVEHSESLFPSQLIMVAEDRVWFYHCYSLPDNLPGLKKESPFDEGGNAIFSLPVDGLRFMTDEEAEQLEKLRDIDNEMLRNAI